MSHRTPPDRDTDGSTGTVTLDRKAVASGAMESVAAEGLVRLLTEQERAATLAAALEGWSPGRDAWLFAYGSLLWNPMIAFEERRTGRLRGYRRRYCLWLPVGRGTPENPGLMLGLEAGGECEGVAYRIAAARVRDELALVWKREMLTGSYLARWLPVETAEGTIDALCFVVDPTHERYVSEHVPPAQVVQHLATAGGAFGTCWEYLERTVTELRAQGLRDAYVERLWAEVRAYREREGGAASRSTR